jgi:Fe-S-cluster containining protein
MGRHAQRRRKTHHTTQRPAQDTPRTIPPELAQECLALGLIPDLFLQVIEDARWATLQHFHDAPHDPTPLTPTERLLLLGLSAMRATDALVDIAPGKATWACTKGCAWCCRSQVEVLWPEVLAIATQIAALPPEVQREIWQRVEANAQQIAPLTEDEHIQAAIPCALLGPEGACRVYEARPVMCRSYCAFNAAQCAASYIVPGVRYQPGYTTDIDGYARTCGSGVSAGMGQALQQVGMPQPQPAELHQALWDCFQGSPGLQKALEET